MKALKILSLMLIAVCFFSVTQAQTNQTLNLRNSNNNLFRYGYQALLTTSDSGTYTIATFPIGNNEAGIMEAQVVGFDSTNGNAITGVKQVRYKKSAGTLTLGTPDASFTADVDSGLSGATFTFDASSNNIRLRVTGDTATTVKWIANVRWINKKQ